MLDRLARQLDYNFRNVNLLNEALTHRSASSKNNERLEFLGDGIVNFVIAAELFKLCPQASEGELSRLRATLVNGEKLAELALALNLGQYLRLGSGELKSGGFRRASILADALEAVFGAVYLDSDFEKCQKLILHIYRDELQSLPDPLQLKDPKTRLQEYLQARKQPLPEYQIETVTGEAHKQTFTVSCSVKDSEAVFVGSGSSRRKAEQEAALKALNKLLGD